jgi:hypothetical protein
LLSATLKDIEANPVLVLESLTLYLEVLQTLPPAALPVKQLKLIQPIFSDQAYPVHSPVWALIATL